MSTPTVTELSGIRFNLVTLPERERRRQVRFPRSKKSRIRKKFAKGPRNWVVEKETDWFLLNQTILQNLISDLFMPARMLPELPVPSPSLNYRVWPRIGLPVFTGHDPFYPCVVGPTS